ncbi:hypothetical protein TTHERM_000287919 (macronuclear) [Tetrahymena thermophila SB210]|uniref:Uncharacterized protein n=1 Tax=Tetrahymena thermophila (strain SB210) TaxID=312017 RepID=W7XBF5_TETTS|nr:hypothetical protein TTHERM_000287919 [Tetrahymena thermophila SB210]8B6G_CL Chain CL, Transposase [Tetrahymena thermophila]8BQS_CL Chain CL, Transposase [Tetrahymena thermophila SB210]8GYM_2L Chain 2L, Transposase [Tetrahymena thermophila SB210]8GYM_2l Chain 2l, Transposase [Tetrahymena thermophila SB210]8GZU_2L Chain 2L, Transposase [Tetrahymena thermophila SB210]8GZU_2l Chain 2l, Transposase [Tetrahymena thermophila SB210]EWS73748.1 hypothetical protein TTHERM_000287919 [Tetrahymena th|eukprot:XP_012653712.1 hypothetical protein TTHERM_000287919 [Tetrahymena thermophila SB210]
MKLDQIISYYITPVRRFDKNLTAEQIYEQYQQAAQFNEIDAFTNIRFHRKFKEYIQTQEQSDYLYEKAKQISTLAQKMFEKKFPEYYTQ